MTRRSWEGDANHWWTKGGRVPGLGDRLMVWPERSAQTETLGEIRIGVEANLHERSVIVQARIQSASVQTAGILCPLPCVTMRLEFSPCVSVIRDNN